MVIVYIIGILVVLLAYCVRIVPEYQRYVVLQFGRLVGFKGPGLVIIWPYPFQTIDRKVDVRTVTMDIPSQDVITKDNVSVKVNAVVYFKVIDVNKAAMEVADYMYATSQLAQTTLRSVCGEVELDDLLGDRENLNTRIQDLLDMNTDPWGIKVSMVELKHIDLPPEMQRAMAKQAEAERERRAKVIAADGEFQASQKLADAAKVIATEPGAMQLRYLQTLSDMSGDQNAQTIIPFPVEILGGLLGRK